MLIVPDDKPTKAEEAEAELALKTRLAHDDPPPSYTANPSSTPSTSATSKTKPTNYVYVNRKNDRIKETFTINPFLNIPPTFLPPLPNGQTEDDRDNLRLEAENGPVDVDVTLLGAPQSLVDSSKLKKRTNLAVIARNGTIQYKLRKFGPETTPHPPFLLKVDAHNGSINVWLPSNFLGAITICAKNGSAKLSHTLSNRVSIHNEQNSTWKYFIGSLDILTESEDPGRWKGDELDILADNGRVRVGIVDELEGGAGRGGFFSRLFG